MGRYPSLIAKNDNKSNKTSIANEIYGLRFMPDQTLIEYLIEFLLVFCSEKDSSESIEMGNTKSGKFRFHDPNHPGDYQMETRMGLRRFILLNKDKRLENAEIDVEAQSKIIEILIDSIDGDKERVEEFVYALQDLFRGYSVVEKKRSWCAQAMLPVCPEFIFADAAPDNKKRNQLRWDDCFDNPEIADKIDTEFSFDKRNFLARGGEVYYLHILQGLKDNPEKKDTLERLLQQMLLKEMPGLSQAARYIQAQWDGFMVRDEPLSKNRPIGYIPETAYLGIEDYAVNELINFLYCKMDPVKKIELLSKGVMLQTMRMLSEAASQKAGYDRDPWIIDMKGKTQSSIRKIASNGLKSLMNTFDIAISRTADELDLTDEECFKQSNDARRRSSQIFKAKGKEMQCIIPLKGAHERMTLSEDAIFFLVLSIVRPGKKMTLDMFLEKLYDHYRIVIGPNEFKKTQLAKRDQNLASCFEANVEAFQDFLNKSGFLHELSDATSVVVNKYKKVGD